SCRSRSPKNRSTRRPAANRHPYRTPRSVRERAADPLVEVSDCGRAAFTAYVHAAASSVGVARLPSHSPEEVQIGRFRTRCDLQTKYVAETTTPIRVPARMP